MASLVFLFVLASVAAAPVDEAYESNGIKTADEEIGASVLPKSATDDSAKNEDVDSRGSPSPGDNEPQTEAWLSQDAENRFLTTDPALPADATESDAETKLPGSESREKKSKKGSRKDKALWLDYPFLPQLPAVPNFDSYDDFGTEERTQGGGGRKRYQESNIYYIRLPPTPYMFVPGLGYVSQPPTYSTPPIRPQISHVRPQVNPYRPHNVYNSPLNEINPFINLPIDFVSNGKPTAVYQWQSPNYQTIKRPESQITTLDKGPYFFNGRPHSIYLLRPDDRPRPPVHQTLQYPDYQDNSYY